VPAYVAYGRARLLGTEMATLDGSIASGAGTALLRPESVTVTADAAGTSTVKSVAFLGPISRVYVALADGAVIDAQLSSAQARVFEPGAAVTVGVEQTRVLVVPS
jgi:putative spermidine/putrescine transport system ATP-binding protein